MRGIAVQKDGRIVVVGSIGSLNNSSTPNGIAGLYATGYRDASFGPSIGSSAYGVSGFDSPPVAVAALGSGELVVVGSFAHLNASASIPAGLIALALRPGVPRQLQAVPGAESAELTWQAPLLDGGAPVTGYAFHVFGGAFLGSPPACQVTGGAYGYVQGRCTGLDNGFEYSIVVSAVNDEGEGSGAAASVTPRAVPSALAAPGIASVGDGTVSVAWGTVASDGGSAVTSYELSTAPGVGCTVDSGTRTAACSGLLNGTHYTFRVRAINAAGAGDWSDWSLPATPRTVPGAVTVTSVRASSGAADITWREPTDDGGAPITSYSLGLVPASGSCAVTGGGGGYVSARCTGLADGTAYSLAIRAVNAAGPAPVTTTSLDPLAVPDAPGTATVTTVGNGALSLALAAPASTGGSAVTAYRISSTPGGGSCAIDAVARTAACTGLANGVAYTFRVRAVNAAGAGEPSDPSIPSTPRTLPAQPGALSVKVGKGTADITFTAPADGGALITRYVITKNRSKGACSVSSVVLATVRVACTGLTSKLTHVFTVKAVNAAGTGPGRASSTVTVTALPGSVRSLAVGRPGLAAVSVARVSVRASWRAPAAFDGMPVTGYRWCLDSCGRGGVWHATTVARGGLGALVAGSAHVLKVRAVNAGGPGATAVLRFTA